MKQDYLKQRFQEGRKIEGTTPGIQNSSLGDTGDDDFSIIELLRGVWASPNQGWNLIALPFRDPSAPFNYRLLMNQYSESLRFNFADKGVPNRGITPDATGAHDQLIDAIDYDQIVTQIGVEDFPPSGLKAKNNEPIHHEPGFFMQALNHIPSDAGKEFRIARLATIPHGDSVLALGTVEFIDGAPVIPNLNALPLGVNPDLQNNKYLSPYQHFEANPFFGEVPKTLTDFPGLKATNANAILQFALPAPEKIKKTTILHFDTAFGTGGIVNIPFVVREANAVEMQATFWILELEGQDVSAPPEFMMLYSQTVFLDFFPVLGDPTKLIRWPHVSINMLRRT